MPTIDLGSDCARELDNNSSVTYHHTWEVPMGKAKIAITLDEKIVGRLDRLVRQRAFTNRSQAIEQAIEEKLSRLDRTRLARESAKLDPQFEKALSEEGLEKDNREWPEF